MVIEWSVKHIPETWAACASSLVRRLIGSRCVRCQREKNILQKAVTLIVVRTNSWEFEEKEGGEDVQMSRRMQLGRPRPLPLKGTLQGFGRVTLEGLPLKGYPSSPP